MTKHLFYWVQVNYRPEHKRQARAVVKDTNDFHAQYFCL